MRQVLIGNVLLEVLVVVDLLAFVLDEQDDTCLGMRELDLDFAGEGHRRWDHDPVVRWLGDFR
jgi:hypothetical protein